MREYIKQSMSNLHDNTRGRPICENLDGKNSAACRDLFCILHPHPDFFYFLNFFFIFPRFFPGFDRNTHRQIGSVPKIHITIYPCKYIKIAIIFKKANFSFLPKFEILLQWCELENIKRKI